MTLGNNQTQDCATLHPGLSQVIPSGLPRYCLGKQLASKKLALTLRGPLLIIRHQIFAIRLCAPRG